jgi:hypothetical protein
MATYPLKLLCLLALLPMAGTASAQARLSDDVLHYRDAAVRQAESGQRPRALACLASLLMSSGITIGMESPGAMSHAVERGIRIWIDRVPGCPLRFTSDPDAAIKVRFVDGISDGGDVQGRLDVHRYVRWGRDHASYSVRGTIQIRNNTDGRALDSDEVAAVMEHELGHLLGLDDEDEPGTLMGPFVAGEPCDGPSDGEVDMVRNFRSHVKHDIDLISRHS